MAHVRQSRPDSGLGLSHFLSKSPPKPCKLSPPCAAAVPCGELAFKVHRLLYHSTLGSRVIKEKKKKYRELLGKEELLERRAVHENLIHCLWFRFQGCFSGVIVSGFRV